MDSNTHSPQGPTRAADQQPTSPSTQPPDDLAALTAVLRRLDSQDPQRLPDAALGDQTLQLQQLSDCLDGVVLRHLAAVDARGVAGADRGVQFGSTAAWLRARLRMASGVATTAVRTARALFRGPLAAAGTALLNGEFSVAHAEVLATSTLHAATQAIQAAEPVLLDAARRLDPSGLRKVVSYVEYTVDPDGADARAQRR
jgi:hypothetical protein